MGLQTAYVPLALAPGIEALDFQNASLYELLRTKYNLNPARARETHMAVLVTDEESMLLRTAVGSPALSAERITYLPDGRPLEYVRSVMRADRYKIVLDLSQQSAE